MDTVPFGCYRRSVFERIGYFDEDLVRNQDDEFNHRLIKNGGRILLVPEIESSYHARPTLRALGRMLYQYGYLKPLAARKLGRILTVRQLVPGGFVLAFLTLLFLSLWWRPPRLPLGMLAATYLVGVLIAMATARAADLRSRLALMAVFPTMHWSYGLGFLRGVVDFIVLRRPVRQRAERMGLTR